MARTRSLSSLSSRWRYCNPSYYLKRPKRLALLFIAFVCCSLVVWDRQTLVREHEVEVFDLTEEVTRLQNMLEELKPGDIKKIVKDDPIDAERRDKVKEAMLHAWTSYEKYAWGFDELQPGSKNGINSFGGLGATLVAGINEREMLWRTNKTYIQIILLSFKCVANVCFADLLKWLSNAKLLANGFAIHLSFICQTCYQTRQIKAKKFGK